MSALIVINPNSSQVVTDGIDAAITPLRSFGTPIRCLTLAAAGYVIACFGDPGLHALRDQTLLPVVGIQEAAVMTALTLGQKFGVIAILPPSIPRHLRAFGAMGVLDRLAGDRALGLGVADLADEGKSLDAMIATGKRLRDEDGAHVLIMGCAGMARYRQPLEEATGLPVVEPTQVAVSMALGLIQLNLSHKTIEI